MDGTESRLPSEVLLAQCSHFTDLLLDLQVQVGGRDMGGADWSYRELRKELFEIAGRLDDLGVALKLDRLLFASPEGE
jgi:hypothetical protein